MSVFIKNNTSIVKKWISQVIEAGEYHEIQEINRLSWGNDSLVLISIASGDAIISKTDDGSTDIIDVNDAINLIKGNSVIVEDTPTAYPFAKKQLEDGRLLFRRKHGVKGIIPANSIGILYIDIPYVICKIDQIEITNGHPDDEIDLKVYDTPEGYIQLSMGVPVESVIPSKLLNQFGFDVNIAEHFYEDKSDYDADLMAGMRVELTYYNNSNLDRNVGINYVLHEIVG